MYNSFIPDSSEPIYYTQNPDAGAVLQRKIYGTRPSKKVVELFSFSTLSGALQLSNLKLLGGLYLGWGIGANDSANIFGTAVATNSVKYKTAIWLIAFFVILGSSLQGWKLYNNYNFVRPDEDKAVLSEADGGSDATSQAYTDAFISTLAAAVAVTIVTVLSIPASTSQAAIGAYMGILIASTGSFSSIDWSTFFRMFVCWVATPIGSAVLTIIMYKSVSPILNWLFSNDLGRLNQVYTFLLIIAGCYGAYELGANNVVVTTGPYYMAGVFGVPLTGDAFYSTPLFENPAFWASTLGGLSIALGALTYSKRVMYTVGSKITALDPYSAMITVFAHSLTLMLFTRLRVPVSSSQAIVGAVVGVGLLSGSRTISFKALGFIFLGWLLTPLSGALMAVILRHALTFFSG